MGLVSHLFYPWGLLLQAAAIIHFIRRQPDRWWLWVILVMGPPGALIYIFVEVIPDAGLLRGTFQAFPRRQQIARLETAIRDNPSAAKGEQPWWKKLACSTWTTASWRRRGKRLTGLSARDPIHSTRFTAAGFARCCWGTRRRLCRTWSVRLPRIRNTTFAAHGGCWRALMR